MPWAVREAVELFHLLFLRGLASGPDKDHYVVKGGCNLRFFFASIRFSEDLDLDVRVTAATTLRNKVERLLGSPVLQRPLEAARIALADVTAPKQTDTTQRWKVALSQAGQRATLPTKIEFSRRGGGRGGVLAPVDSHLTRRYRLAPTLLCHYELTEALAQKLEALAGRREAQARDVFDLAWLLSRAGTAPRPLPHDRGLARRALEHLWSLDYDDYAGQVLSYLAPEENAPYASREAWEAMQLQVAGALEGK